ncbi:MAG: hypothetical protein R2795_26610 [Saprospiraceae bacterium]
MTNRWVLLQNPSQGYLLMATKAPYTGDIELSNKGLQGKGELEIPT